MKRIPQDEALGRVGERVRHNARKVELDGIVFGSGHEADVYQDLKLQQRAGLIRKLQVHPKFVFVVNGVRIGYFKPDFTFLDERDAVRVVEAKGFKRSPKTGRMLPRVDKGFTMRKKLMKALFGLEVEIL